MHEGEIHEDGLVHDRTLVGVNVIEVTESDGRRIISSAIDIPLSPHGGVDEQVRKLIWVVAYGFDASLTLHSVTDTLSTQARKNTKKLQSII